MYLTIACNTLPLFIIKFFLHLTSVPGNKLRTLRSLSRLSFPACALSPSPTEVRLPISREPLDSSEAAPVSVLSLPSFTLVLLPSDWATLRVPSPSAFHRDMWIKTPSPRPHSKWPFASFSPSLTSSASPSSCLPLGTLTPELVPTIPWFPVSLCSPPCFPNTPLPFPFPEEPYKSLRSISKRESAPPFPPPCSLHTPPLPQATACLHRCSSGFLSLWAVIWRGGVCFKCLVSLAPYRMPGIKQTVGRCLLNEWMIIITSHIPSIQTLRLSSEHGVPSLTLFDKEKKKSNPSAIQ